MRYILIMGLSSTAARTSLAPMLVIIATTGLAAAASCSLPRGGSMSDPLPGQGGSPTTTSTTSSGAWGTTTTSTSTSSTTSTGVGGDGAGGGAVAENCLDGEDNDGDNDVDCADADCANAGYVSVEGDAATEFVTEGACGDGLVAHNLYDCGSCGCDLALGRCGLEVTLFKSSNCDGSAVQSPYTACVSGSTDPCCDIQDFNNGDELSASVRAIVTEPPVCSPNTATVGATTLAYCEPQAVGAGLGSGTVCLPPPSGTAWCVLVDQGTACPGDTTPRGVFEGGSETCTCGCVRGQPTCNPNGASVVVSDRNDCTGNAYGVPSNGSCVVTEDAHGLKFLGESGMTMDATCSSSVAIDGATERVVCCPG